MEKKRDFVFLSTQLFYPAREKGFSLSIGKPKEKLSPVFISFFIRRINHRKNHFWLPATRDLDDGRMSVVRDVWGRKDAYFAQCILFYSRFRLIN